MRESDGGEERRRRPKAGRRERHAQLLGRIDALVEIIRMLAGQVELDDLLALIAARTSETMNAERSTIYLVDEARQELWSRFAQGLGGLEIRLKMGQGLAGHAWKTGEAAIADDAYSDPRFDPQFDRLTSWKTKDVVAVPMRDYQEKIVGVFEVMNHQSGRFTQEDAALLTGLASAATAALESARLRAQVTYDFLTGLRNRRGFQELYERELLKAKRYPRPLALIMLDVDNLKGINDTYGHRIGDEVLKAVGRLMEKSFRTADLLARYGGDEFVALLPETDEPGAAACVGRLEEAIAQFNQLGALPVPISVSVGIAPGPLDQEDLLELADKAMYAHKARLPGPTHEPDQPGMPPST